MIEKRPSPRRPAKIGEYEIRDILGSGGMGVVYRGYDHGLNREVAIKQLTDGFRGNPEMLKRFSEEAEKQAKLRHNNIVTVFGAGKQDGDPYIVMEFIKGDSLEKKIRQREQLELGLILSIGEQVCRALHYAHRRNLIHRDVKPANIIIEASEEAEKTAKIFDFGIARDDSRLDKTSTSTGVMVGTPPYMAPERFKGAAIDGRSDLFSVGVVLYELITGKRPFDGPDVPAVVDQVLRYHPPAPSTVVADCPASLDAIIARALAKSPLDRYSSGDEMAMALRDAATELTQGQVAKLMGQAQKLVEERKFLPAQSALQKILLLNSQHVAAKDLLRQVGQQITLQERVRKSRDLARKAEEAMDDKDFPRAMRLCDEALSLNTGSATLTALRQSIVEAGQNHERVSQYIAESQRARRDDRLDDAIHCVQAALELDPNNSQLLALNRELVLDAENARLKVELQELLTAFHEHLEARQLKDAAYLLDRAKAIAPESIQVLRARDELATAQTEGRRRTIVRSIEEKVHLATSIEQLAELQTDLTSALAEFPNDPYLYGLRRTFETRMRQMENEQLVREARRRASELGPEDGLLIVGDALRRLPGNEELAHMQDELRERAERGRRAKLLAQRLGEARQLIDDGLPKQAEKLLERTQAEGYSSYELEGLLEIAKSAGSEAGPKETLERTYADAKQLIDQGAYANAILMLQRASRDLNEPVLRRLLEEARQKQAANGEDAASAMENAERLLRIGLFEEAVNFLEGQPAGVKRLPEVDVALRRARVLRQGEEETFSQLGRCYAQLGSKQAADDLKKLLVTDTIDDEQGSREAAKARLRDRCQEIYGEKASHAIATAKKFLSKDDHQGAEEVLEEALMWIDLAPKQSQQDLRALHAEASGARGLFGLRRSRR